MGVTVGDSTWVAVIRDPVLAYLDYNENHYSPNHSLGFRVHTLLRFFPGQKTTRTTVCRIVSL